MTTHIDINCDVGEISFEIDRALLPYVSSCNVSCGAHAGDPVLITSTIREAIRLNIAVGAHPGYPDRANFGRNGMEISLSDLSDHLRFQIGTVKAITESFGSVMRHVKPHGALYHDVVFHNQIAMTFLDVVSEIDSGVFVIGQANSPLAELCCRRGVPFVHEAFGDRHYADGTTLVPRSRPDAVVEDLSDFDQQMQHLLAGQVVDVEGKTHSLTVNSICLHGDTKDALPFAKRAKQLLHEFGVAMQAASLQ